jgi:hypothetical protein
LKLFEDIEKNKKNLIEFVDDKINIIDMMSFKKKFDYGNNEVQIHDLKFCGMDCLEKYENVFNFINNYLSKNQKMYEKSIKAYEEAKLKQKTISFLITKLDDIACNIFN